MTRIVEVVEYNPNWPKFFASETKLLIEALGDNCIVVHHIGSTSVPGLAAKPIIDILPVIKDLSKIDDSKLVAIGYTPRGEMGMPFRRFYNKGEPQRTHHLHIWENGNPEIQKHLLFKKHLISHPEVATNAELKFKLADKFRIDRENYTGAKDSLIKEILQKSGFNGLTIVQANLPSEWQAYKKIMHIENPVISEQDLYFVLIQGVEIVGVAHIQKTPIMKIIALRCDNAVLENYMSSTLGQWTKSGPHD